MPGSLASGRVEICFSIQIPSSLVRPGPNSSQLCGTSIMDSQRSWVLRTVLSLGGSAVLIALVTSGCGVSSASSEAVQVWGRVTYGGKPLEGGAIIFMPMEDLHTNWGVGQIDNQGMYRLSTYIPKTSLEPGPTAFT